MVLFAVSIESEFPRMHVLLSPCWMLRAVALVSRLVMYIFRIISEVCCLLPVPGIFVLAPLDSGSVYPSPPQNDIGHQRCSCNSMMYKYEAWTSRRGSCADFLFTI